MLSAPNSYTSKSSENVRDHELFFLVDLLHGLFSDNERITVISLALNSNIL